MPHAPSSAPCGLGGRSFHILAAADYTQALELLVAENWDAVDQATKDELTEAVGETAQAQWEQATAETRQAQRAAREGYYFGRAEAHRAVGELDLAVADYTRALELLESAAVAESWEAVDQATKDQLTETAGEAAQAQWEQATAEARQAQRAAREGYYSGRAEAHRALGELDLALADYDLAIELDEANGAHLLGRSKTYLELGRGEQAQADYAAATELDPALADDEHEVALAGEAPAETEQGDEAIEEVSTGG